MISGQLAEDEKSIEVAESNIAAAKLALALLDGATYDMPIVVPSKTSHFQWGFTCGS